MIESRNIYNSERGYITSKERLRNNNKIPLRNRKLAIKWLDFKEKEIIDNIDKKDLKNESKRFYLTLNKYVTLLNNICYWFPDLKKVTKKDLMDFKINFNQDKIKSINGKVLKCKSDYYNKIIKSHFFKFFLGYEKIVKEVFNGKLKKEKTAVEYITLEDLKVLIETSRYDYQRLIFSVLFTSGLRIGEFLNLKKWDFELKYNNNTKIYYYIIHLKKEYSKSRENRNIPILLPETNNILQKYLNKLDDSDLICNLSYEGVRKIVTTISKEAKIKTKPNNDNLRIHTLRKSCALYLLNSGYSTDQVKSILGHKPSSEEIDVYVNYLGLEFEPEITKVQTDRLLDMQKELEYNRLQMTTLQQQMEERDNKFNVMQKQIEKMMKLQEINARIKKY